MTLDQSLTDIRTPYRTHLHRDPADLQKAQEKWLDDPFQFGVDMKIEERNYLEALLELFLKSWDPENPTNHLWPSRAGHLTSREGKILSVFYSVSL